MELGESRELQLRVAEGLGDDVGRKWARLDAEDLARLGAVPGDVLLITGGRSTVARATQAPLTHCGKQLRLIDGNTRGDAQPPAPFHISAAHLQQALRRVNESVAEPKLQVMSIKRSQGR